MDDIGLSRLVVAPMEERDIPQVTAIDRRSFANPWSAESYHYELAENQAAHFLVALAAAEPGVERRVMGYAGYWLIVDEAHIGTLAVHPDWRRRGLGEKLLAALLHQARELGALTALLEVRAGNLAAQGLYRKQGFEEVGRRKGYYRDNAEDALLLTARFDDPHAPGSL
jgi:[ribosomal protein S18]-alanine N-acetyltransferase